MKVFESLESYLKLARVMIIAHTSVQMRKKMLSSEDAVSDIASAIMKADNDFNGHGTLQGFRKERAVWAICKYIKDLKKETYVISGDFDFDQYYSHRTDDPEKQVLYNEEITNIKKLLNSDNLTNKQSQYLNMMFVDGLTLSEIARKTGTSRQNIEQIVKNGISRLKLVVHNSNSLGYN